MWCFLPYLPPVLLPLHRLFLSLHTRIQIKHEWHAALSEPTLLAKFAAIDIPTLYLIGSDSKLSTRAVAGLLTGVLPDVRVENIEGVGHMAPVTHPEKVNPVIEEFLQEMTRRSGRADPAPVAKA